MGGRVGKKSRKLGDLASHIISIDWLKQTVLIYDSAKKAREELGTEGIKPACGSGGAGYAENDMTGELLFWIILNTPEPSIGLVVHEVTHCVDFLLEAVGIPVDVKTAEVRCYMVEWLTNEVIGRMGIKA